MTPGWLLVRFLWYAVKFSGVPAPDFCLCQHPVLPRACAGRLGDAAAGSAAVTTAEVPLASAPRPPIGAERGGLVVRHDAWPWGVPLRCRRHGAEIAVQSGGAIARGSSPCPLRTFTSPSTVKVTLCSRPQQASPATSPEVEICR